MAEQNNGKSGQICRDFQRGECDRGSRCKFSHDMPGDGFSGDSKERICRDFLRDECTRGDKCLFTHPAGKQGTNKLLKFCHNYQNGTCERPICSYVHGSTQDEEYYKETGRLPPGVLEPPSEAAHSHGVCKDFLNGKCFRSKCKFLHMDEGRGGGGGGGGYDGGPPPRKRPMPYWDQEEYPPQPPRDERERIRSLVHMVQDLEDENVVLRHKLGRVHRQLLEHADDNKLLVEENRRLKSSVHIDADVPRALPRRSEAAESVVDSYLRERPVSSRGGAALSREDVAPRPGARAAAAAAFESYGAERPSQYDNRLAGNYDYASPN